MTAAAAPRRQRDPAGLGKARQACARVHAAGREVTVRAVQAELRKWLGIEASMRDVATAAAEWRGAMLERCSGRIEAAVSALLVLETDLERDAVRRAVEQRTAGGVCVRFIVKRRAKRPPARTGQGGAP